MGCKIEPTNKKEFGISMYATLKKAYGYKNHYEVVEIKEVGSLVCPFELRLKWQLVLDITNLIL